MARIPMGNFGFSGPQAVQASNINTRVRSNEQDIWEQTGENIRRAGARVSDVFERKAAEEKEIKQMEAATKVMQYETNLKRVRSELEQKYDMGELTWDAMDGAWQQAKSQIEKPVADVDDPVFQERMNLQLQQIDISADDSWNNTSSRARKGAMQAATLGAVDQMYKANIDKPQVVEQYLSSPEFEQKGRMAFGEEWPLRKTSMIEGAYTNSYTERVIAAGDNVGALQAIKAELDSDEVKMRLDPQKRLSLSGNIQNNIMTLTERAERRAELERERSLKAAENAHKRFFDNIMDGAIMPVDEMNATMEAVKGTPYEQSIIVLQGQQAEIQKIMALPTEERESTLDAMERRLLSEGSTKEQRDMLSSLRTASNKRKDLEQNDPISYAELQAGMESSTVDWGQPDPKAMQERLLSVQAVESRTGKPANIMKPNERKALVEALDEMNDKQRKQYFATLKLNAGDSYERVMKEIGYDKPAYSIAGQLQGSGKKIVLETSLIGSDTVIDADKVSSRLLRGADILKKSKEDGKMPIPDDEKFNASLTASIGTAVNDAEAFAKVKDTVKSYYAALSEEQGKFSSVVDEKILQEAIAATVGNVAEKGNRKIIVPYGMDSNSFLEKAEEAYNKTGVSLDWDDVTLMPYEGNKYMIATGNQPIKSRKTGRPVIIEVK